MKKNLTLLLILFLLFSFDGTFLYSQYDPYAQPDFNNYNEVIGKSPTAAQFLRYDELPVSEYTGIPNINIPLYDIEVDNIKVPLVLSYHAGGLKVTQEASWVGLGWDIPAVASVTQIVKDANDLTYYNQNHTNDFYPDWRSNGAGEYSSFYYQDCWLSAGETICLTYPIYDVSKQFGYYVSTNGWVVVNGVYVQRPYDMTNSTNDSEPDIFKINIQGKTLNCIINKDVDSDNPQFIVLNKKGYIVNFYRAFVGTMYDLDNSSWEIIDPQGIKYYLRTKSQQTNLSVWQGDGIHSTVWYVDSIVSTDGRNIKFNYLQAGTFTNNYNKNIYAIQVYGWASIICDEFLYQLCTRRN
jgi:hypothetical protein